MRYRRHQGSLDYRMHLVDGVVESEMRAAGELAGDDIPVIRLDLNALPFMQLEDGKPNPAAFDYLFQTTQGLVTEGMSERRRTLLGSLVSSMVGMANGYRAALMERHGWTREEATDRLRDVVAGCGGELRVHMEFDVDLPDDRPDDHEPQEPPDGGPVHGARAATVAEAGTDLVAARSH